MTPERRPEDRKGPSVAAGRVLVETETTFLRQADVYQVPKYGK